MISKENVVWKNVIQTQEVRPLQYLIPESLQDVLAAVRQAEENNCRIRPIGSGHSPSDIAVTDGYLLDMRQLNASLKLEKEKLKADHQASNTLVEVEAGISLRKLNAELDAKDLSLINMGAIDEQTISGAIATCTHGTGRKLPSLAGQVRSMVLVASEGRIFRIEPTDGISDPQQYKDQEVELIQDNDVFNSALVHLGAMGIIYSYILEVRPMYWLYEQRKVHKWSEIKQKLRDKSIFDDFTIELEGKKQTLPVRGLTIMVNPYPVNGDYSCLVGRYIEVDEPKNLPKKYMRRDPVSEFVGSLAITYYAVITMANKFFNFVPKMLESSLHKLEMEKYVNKSYKVLLTGSSFMMKKSYSCEFAYDLNGDAYIHAMEAFFEKIQELSSQYKVYPAFPIGIRFTGACPAYLSPENGHDVCYIVTPSMTKQKCANLILNSFQDVHIAHGGRPHWAKMTNRIDGRNDLIRSWYPKYDIWHKVMRQFNPNDTFSNAFTDRMGLTSELKNSQKEEALKASPLSSPAHT